MFTFDSALFSLARLVELHLLTTGGSVFKREEEQKGCGIAATAMGAPGGGSTATATRTEGGEQSSNDASVNGDTVKE